MGHVVLIASVVLQILAALVAIRLAVVRPSRAWFLVATAVGLMAVRRGFTLVSALDSGSAIDTGAETIALLISALMVSGLFSVLRGVRPADASDSALDTPHVQPSRLSNTAMVLGVLAMLASVVVGLYAYRASRNAVVKGVQANMLRFAHSLANLAGSHVKNGDIDAGIAALKDHWTAFDQSETPGDLCIIRRNGEVVLNTEDPESVGQAMPVCEVTLLNGETLSTVDVAERGLEVAGWVDSPGGGRQIAAFAISEPLDSLICLHVPASVVEGDVHATAIPWAVALVLATVVLLPVSLILFHRAYAVSQRLIEEKNRLLSEREERLRSVVEQMPVMMNALDQDGNIVLWNRECERVTGYSADEIIGNPKAWELLYRDADYCRRLQDERRERGNDYRDWEWETTCKDGKVRRIAWSNCSMQFPVTGWSTWSIGVDVTWRRESELAARERMAQLARLERLRSVGELATGIAHELNQPLTAIANYAQGGARRLEGGKVDADTLRPVMSEIATQAHRAADIIRTLRGFVGGVVPRLEPANLNEIVNAVVDLFEPHAHMRKMGISLDLCSSLPLVMVERVQIQQVLVNLVRNSIDAMDGIEPEDRRLEIATTIVPNGFVEVSVRDSGCGLDKKALEFALDPFFTTKAGGLGMGLPISRSIIEAHDGVFIVDTDCKVGAVFRFRLPTITRSD